MNHDDDTNIGGWDGDFHTTHWTEILKAHTQDESRQRAALDVLLRRYWKPVYCYLRRKGYKNEESEDLAQSFFHEVVLGRKLIQKAKSSQGRFRTFLLTALKRYVIDTHRIEKAKKRVPEPGLISFADIEWLNVPERIRSVSPNVLFDYAWASSLLDQVLTEVESACCGTGQTIHWAVFNARILQPIIENADPPSLGTLCLQHGISNESVASNMIITVKRRLQAAMRRHVRDLVASDSDVDQEIRGLAKIFSDSGAGF